MVWTGMDPELPPGALHGLSEVRVGLAIYVRMECYSSCSSSVTKTAAVRVKAPSVVPFFEPSVKYQPTEIVCVVNNSFS